MNFITFPVGSTNIFPAANGTNGSQLMTEWNLRCREMVDTNSEISYESGHSFAHSVDDFSLQTFTDDSGVAINPYTLQINPGRAIVNGHFIESLVPVTVDLVEANATLKSQSRNPLKGILAVGLRAYYATDETVAGTLLVENDNRMYLGIQVVILPEEEFITPESSPLDKSKVTAHLKLGSFNFSNNRITSIKNYAGKVSYLPAERLTNIDMLVSSSYVRKTGLNPKRMYAFAGKGTDPATGLDTWEDVTDSTVVWDANPVRTTVQPSMSQAAFLSDNDTVYLAVPHKQIEGMKDSSGNAEYYKDRLIEFPVADYATGKPGTVDKSYTQQIKNIAARVQEFRTTLNGKQILYIDTKNEDTDLPSINPAWNVGDYVAVRLDYTVADSTDAIRQPSTMYAVLPGKVLTIQFVSKVEGSDTVPSSLTGCELVRLDWFEDSRDPEPETDDPEYFPEFFAPEDDMRGTPGKDYFRVKYTYSDRTFANFYYSVATADKREWSLPIFLTGEIALADESTVGGFINASTDMTDYGYVYRDETGHLKLVDYALLRSGTLAYQLAQDVELPSGVTASETQQYINEFINQRVAFPNEAQLSTDHPNCIHVYLSLYEEETATEINIGDIDSRFNTSVCLHILGSATSTTVINIHDCEKLKIDNEIEGTPVINIYRCNLYYDPYVFNYIRSCARSNSLTFTGMEDITIWYEMFDNADANLVVTGMTVSELDAPVAPTEISYWQEVNSYANDNHYLAALKSITFAGNGTVVQCGLLVSNQSTDNVDPGDKIVVAEFELPQGTGLVYPKSCLTKQLKITGTFVSAYSSDNQWYVTDTSFSALTNKYDEYDLSAETKGNIAFHSKTTVIDSTISQTVIPAWESDTYHLFFGGTVG